MLSEYEQCNMEIERLTQLRDRLWKKLKRCDPEDADKWRAIYKQHYDVATTLNKLKGREW